MLTELQHKFPIQPIIDQVKSLTLDKRFDLNTPTGKFFNDPWQIKNEFIGTPLGHVLESIPNCGQARLLKLESGESYTAHTDPDDRVHLAIVSNEYSFLVDVDNGNLHYLPVDGQLWLMDTSRVHVAANWGGWDRIHLNVRVLLPAFDSTKPGMYFKVIDGLQDWKQASYIELMGNINQGIKHKIVTGFDAPNERELYINTTRPDLFKPIIDNIKARSVELLCETF